MISSWAYVKFNLFAVVLSLSPSVDRLVTKSVIAGSAVSFNCTLNESCAHQSIQWVHYSTLYTRPEVWYRSRRLNHDILHGRGVTVEEDSAGGWSVLSIPGVMFADRGRFYCVVTRLHHSCQMNFKLTVTGNICKI